VQETLLRAISHIDSFRPGTNVAAWLLVILRNVYRSERRKRWREVEDAMHALCAVNIQWFRKVQ
jgi:RNA polymerase sigma-70 factor (ECF subfamily)